MIFGTIFLQVYQRARTPSAPPPPPPVSATGLNALYTWFFSGTLFAYGQTTSGKTYTMSGTEDSPDIIPYALDEMFSYIPKSRNREFLLRVSYMELYNEIITDLLI